MRSKLEAEYVRIRSEGRSARRPPPETRTETPEERAAGIERTKAWQESAGTVHSKVLTEDSLRVRADLKRMHRERILREYAEAGLAVPEDSDHHPIASLPLLMAMGYTIRDRDGTKTLVKPDHPPPLRRSMGY